MKKQVIGGASAIALMAVVAVAAVGAHAGTDKYKFVARGIVQTVEESSKTITVSITHTSDKAKNDLVGNTQEFNLAPAKLYKTAAGKEGRIKVGTIKVGDEVVMKGVAKTDGRFNVTWLHVNDRTFQVVGILKDHDKPNRTMKIQIKTSSYHPATYKGVEVIMHYTGNTKFTSEGQTREADSIDPDDQKVKVTGTISGSGTWDMTSLIERYVEK